MNFIFVLIEKHDNWFEVGLSCIVALRLKEAEFLHEYRFLQHVKGRVTIWIDELKTVSFCQVRLRKVIENDTQEFVVRV